MVVIAGTTDYLKIFLLTSAVLAIHMVKDSRIIPIFWIIGEFLMSSQGNSQVLKGSNQIMTPRFSDVDGIAAIARVTIK